MNLKSHIAAFTGAHRYILGPLNWFSQQIAGLGFSNRITVTIQLENTIVTAVANVDLAISLNLNLEDTIVTVRLAGNEIVMSQFNDNILLVTGGPTVMDGLLSFYQANGASSNSLTDAAYEFLLARGVPDTSTRDMWFTFLSGLTGIDLGTNQEMKAQWWAAGAPLV